ncbi:MAG: hypothetical protein ACRD38_05205, partial [Nitrososphaerales archaeon]
QLRHSVYYMIENDIEKENVFSPVSQYRAYDNGTCTRHIRKPHGRPFRTADSLPAYLPFPLCLSYP